MTTLFTALLSLAAVSLGLRTTGVILGARLHPLLRLAISIAIGAVFVLVTLDIARNLRVFELGLGLLASMAPVGVYDVVKWWYRWRLRTPRST
jgi:hypothetical protein